MSDDGRVKIITQIVTSWIGGQVEIDEPALLDALAEDILRGLDEHAALPTREVSNRFIDFLYVLARDHLTTGAIEDIMYTFVDTEESSFCNHFIEGYARDLAVRLLDDSVPITNWKHMYRSPDGKTKFTGGVNPHYGS